MVLPRAVVLVLIGVALWPLSATPVLGQVVDESSEAGAPARVNAHGTGTLAVTSSPWTTVIIDGRHAGTAPWEGTLSVGRHRVRLVRSRPFIDYTATVTVLAGERSLLQHRVEIPAVAPLPPEEARYRTAQRCASAGDHECVIGELRNHCVRARDYELYIASLRAGPGYDLEIAEAMRAYIARYPTERFAPDYRAYLLAHPNGP
jgi:hypothetical protein